MAGRDDTTRESEAEAPPAGRWREVARSPEFRELEAMRRRAVAILLGVFVVVLGTFLILCGYARGFMGRSVDGGLTVAYVWLLALTVLAWVLTWSYLRFSERRLEPLAQKIAARYAHEQHREDRP